MALDPITFDILWSRLIATVNEQAAGLIRSSFTSIVREAGDLSAGVFDRKGRMVAQAVTGTPGHINSMATGMVHVLEKFPIDTMKPGDVFATNDPWMTASQLNDITITTPVFKNGMLVGFFANCCHALDIGGRGLSADSRSVFEEGLQIPIMRIHDEGKPIEPFFELLAANVRTPEEVLGDIHSQIVGNEIGARQLLSFMDEFGLDDIEELAQEIIDRTEAAMRERVEALPDGTYSFTLTIDGFDEPVDLKADVIISGSDIEVRYDAPPAVSMGINVTLNYTKAYTTYGLKCAISPDVPNNEGSFRPVKVTAAEGSLLNAKFPAAVGGRHLVGHFLPSVMMGALSGIIPDRVMAPGFDGLWDTHISGSERGTDRHFSYTWFSSGGTGALKAKDGFSATAYPSGIAGVPAEVIEAVSPLVVHRRELRTDSAGAGKFRGGLGQTMEIEVLTDEPYLFSGLYERTRHPSPGLEGGHAAPPGKLSTSNGTPLEPKISALVPADTVVTLDMPGGGGFGAPCTRTPESVAHDLKEGYISKEAAESVYKVIIDPKAGVVDHEATAKARATGDA